MPANNPLAYLTPEALGGIGAANPLAAFVLNQAMQQQAGPQIKLGDFDLLDIRQRARTPADIAAKHGVSVGQLVSQYPEINQYMPKQLGEQLLNRSSRQPTTAEKAITVGQGVKQGFEELNQVLAE